MDEHENLPAVIVAQALAVLSERRVSLVGRGLAAVQNSKNSKNDTLYRQARAVFDRNRNLRGNRNAAYDPAIFSIFQQLADQNYGKAYYPLSYLYRVRNDAGDRKARQYTQLALAWCLANQANDDAELWCDMGDMHSRHNIADYFEGCGVTQSNEIAEVCYRKAAEMGNEWGQGELGLLLHRPSGGIQENEQAFYWMEQAAQQGSAIMLEILHDLYDVNRDAVNWFRKSADWYRKSADRGNEVMQCELGRMYLSGNGVEQNYEQAVYWFRKSAEQGDEVGQWMLGEMYYDGKGVEQNYEQAMYMFHKSAEQGGGTMQLKLGLMFANGRRVVQDNEQAMYWFHKAAEHGHVDQWELGDMYLSGNGVEQNYEQAMYWLHNSAEQGEEVGQWMLGEMYYDGKGVEQNYEQAVYWYRKSAEQGWDEAQEALRKLGIDWKK